MFTGLLFYAIAYIVCWDTPSERHVTGLLQLQRKRKRFSCGKLNNIITNLI